MHFSDQGSSDGSGGDDDEPTDTTSGGSDSSRGRASDTLRREMKEFGKRY